MDLGIGLSRREREEEDGKENIRYIGTRRAFRDASEALRPTSGAVAVVSFMQNGESELRVN